jgi:predicted kinase
VHRKRLRPRLILVTGVAGSGKTTLSKEIVRHVGAAYLDNNHIVDAFFPNTRSGAAYAKLRPRFYRALYTIAEENLKMGNSVLLDVPHVKEMQDAKWRAFITRLAAGPKAKLVVIRCFCSDAVLRSRLKTRGETRDSWKLSHWQAFLAEQPILTLIPFPHLEIDTERNLSRNVNTAVRYILKADRAHSTAKRTLYEHVPRARNTN